MGDGFITFVRISQLTVLIPFLVGSVRLKSLTGFQKLVYTIVCVSTLVETLAIIITDFLEIRNNVPVYNLYTIVYFLILLKIYLGILNGYFLRRMLKALGLIYVLFSIFNLVYYQPITVLNSNLIVFSFLVFIVLSILFFSQKLREANEVFLEHNPVFWLNTGVLLYNSGALILFVFINQLGPDSTELIKTSWAINLILGIILNGFYTITLWMRSKV